MKITIRKTNKDEFYQTENLTREAFWNLFQPGCDEHLVLHQLRRCSNYLEELDHIALINDGIVGHILTTKAKVIDSQNIASEVLCVGPVSVLPEFQKTGIGSRLMRQHITLAKEMGFNAMILFGHPDYYRRFGFRNAAEYRITTKDGQNFEPFMALELQADGLTGIKGKFYEDEAFVTDQATVDEFEKLFPYKEKGQPKMEINH